MMADTWDDAYRADHALVDAAQTGSVEAYSLLVDRYHAQVLGYLRRQVGDPETAADLAQETFMDAYRDLHKLADDRPFAAWLYVIARNNLLAERRKSHLRRLVSLDGMLERAREAIPALRRADRTAESDERDLIQRVLEGLSPALREALLLHSLWGFRSEEVAQSLGIAPAAARQRIARAKEQFRLCYKAMDGDDVDPIV